MQLLSLAVDGVSEVLFSLVVWVKHCSLWVAEAGHRWLAELPCWAQKTDAGMLYPGLCAIVVDIHHV